MKILPKTALLPVLALALSACGGGGGGSSSGGGGPTDGRTGPPRAASYEALTSTADARSVLGGTAVRIRDSFPLVEATRITGNLQHDTGRLVVRDDLDTFVDRDGSDQNGIFVDANNAAILTNASDLQSRDYEYVTTYAADYRVDNVDYTLLGAAGIATRNSDVPSVGSASYTGDAFAFVANGNTGTNSTLTDGRSRVDANFAAGTVDVTLDDFARSVDTDTGRRVTAPLDRITVRGMEIDGNGFSGGTISMQNNGRDIAIGLTFDEGAAETFYGYDDTTLAPAETAGQVYRLRSSGVVVSGFVAD